MEGETCSGLRHLAGRTTLVPRPPELEGRGPGTGRRGRFNVYGRC